MGLDDALIVLERLRAAIARGGFDAIAPASAVRFSAGLIQWRTGEPQDAAIDRADQAPKQSKNSGRDRAAAA